MRRFLLLLMLAVCTLTASAEKFEVDGICYSTTSDSTVSVTYSGEQYYSSSTYKGNVVIPASVIYDGHTYSVTSVGEHAFYSCKALKSVSIPSSVTTIETEAFSYCDSLTSVSIPSSVSIIEMDAFWKCYSLKGPVYLLGVKSIGYEAFSRLSYNRHADAPDVEYCDFVIGDSLNSVSDYAFDSTSKLYVNKGASLFCLWSRGKYTEQTYDRTTKEKITGPKFSRLTTMSTAEANMDGPIIEGITYKIAYGYTHMKTSNQWNRRKGEYEKVYTRPTDRDTTILSNENKGILKFVKPNGGFNLQSQSGFRNQLNRVEYSLLASLDGSPDEYTLWSVYDDIPNIGKPFKILRNTASSIVIKVETPKITHSDKIALASSSYITLRNIKDGNETSYIEGDTIVFTGMDPYWNSMGGNNYGYYWRGTTRTTSSGPIYYGDYNFVDWEEDTDNKKILTETLNFVTQSPKVISEGNVVVSATSNIDPEEEDVGFEWRRTDWTDDFNSNTGKAYMYDSIMEGYIRNMATAYLWKYRPYYNSKSGIHYAGDWVGIDPTNTSYFEPTVHTYANISVNGNEVTLNGYVQRGSDNVASKGFMYWKDSSVSGAKGRVRRAPSVPDDAQTVTVKGSQQLMEAKITGLDYNSTYAYVAFVTTSEGDTYYGDERTFETGASPTGIDEIRTDVSTKAKYPAGIYDLNGRKLGKMQRGINIVRYEDGTVKKIVVK